MTRPVTKAILDRHARGWRPLLVLVWLIGACGDGGGGGGTAPPPPPPAGDPARGESANALVENLGLEIWIGIDDPAVAGEVRSNFEASRVWWIAGEIVPEPDARLGFIFEPSTVFTAEVTIEAIQTTLEQIRTDPAHFAPGGEGGLPAWAVAARILKLETP